MKPIIILLLFLLLFSCTKNNKAYTMAFPKTVWISKTPEALGVNPEMMKIALEYLTDECGIDKLDETMIIKNGYVIYKGDSIHKKHNIYSSSKSFTSTVLGLLTDKGLISEDTYAHEIDDRLKKEYPKVQLKHFASMTSGYSAKGDSRWNEPSKDWSRTPFIIDTALFAPGAAYAYWDEAQMMFGRLLTIVSGKTLKSIFNEYIGEEIGMGDFEWWGDESYEGIPLNNGCTGVTINPEQLARFGHFFLNEGRWNDKQLLSKIWIHKAITNRVFTTTLADTDRNNIDGRGCYGYNWWVNGSMPSGHLHMPDAPKSLYYASGFNNNMCFIIPEWQMVIVRMGEDGNPSKGKPYVYNQFFKRMGRAMAIAQ